jgi:transcriptional regulator with XRE-family HTH domain
MELAEALGVTAAMIVYCERRAANPSLELLLKLSGALDVSVGELIGEEAPAKRKRPGPTSELEERFEKLRQLPRRDQETVLRMLDGLLAAHP